MSAYLGSREKERNALGERTAISELSTASLSSIISSTKDDVASCFIWPFLTTEDWPLIRGSKVLPGPAYCLVCSAFTSCARAMQIEGEKHGRNLTRTHGRVRNVAAIVILEEVERRREIQELGLKSGRSTSRGPEGVEARNVCGRPGNSR